MTIRSRPHVSYLVSCNGFGHFRRAALIVRDLKRIAPETEVTMFCSPGQLRGARRWNVAGELARAGVRFQEDLRVGFEWPLPTDRADPVLSWLDPLSRHPGVLDADLVVSDNLAGVLSVRADAVLTGSFLWSEVVVESAADRAAEFVEHELSLLRRIRPRMICVEGLATRGVLRETNAIQVPWICDDGARPADVQQRDEGLRVAITAGTTEAALGEARHVVAALAGHVQLICDAALARDPGVRTHITGVLPPDGDFSDVDVVVCRPGAGTVSDCVAQGIPFLLFLDDQNAEMRSNAERLRTSRLADVLLGTRDPMAIRSAVLRFADASIRQEQAARLQSLRKDGARRAAEELVALMPRQAIPA